MKKQLEDLLKEEQDLQFNSFNEADAWKLGNLLVEEALSEGLPVTIDITRSGQQLFHVSLPGTTVDNDVWVRRKINLVNRFGHSSFYMGQYLKNINKTIEEVLLVSESDFAPHGGSFPITLSDSGIIGTVTVSGLPQEDDHKLVVSAIKSYISEEF
jgi:uncharacterized protein (UPF0303 family)